MQKAIMLVLLAVGVVNVANAQDIDDGISVETETVVTKLDKSTETAVWPDDYQKWEMKSTGKYFDVNFFNKEIIENNYVMAFTVRIGTITAYEEKYDSSHSNGYFTRAVLEYDILGNGVKMRVFLMLTRNSDELQFQYIQLLKDGKWISGRKGGLVTVLSYNSPEEVLRGALAGVLLTLELDGNRPSLELYLENKWDAQTIEMLKYEHR